MTIKAKAIITTVKLTAYFTVRYTSTAITAIAYITMYTIFLDEF
jgi:hypothetical protein